MKHLLLSLLLPALLAAAPLAGAHTITLGEQYHLVIASRADLTTVALSQQGELQEAVSIGNSLFDARDIRHERLCNGCEKAYLIPVPDASSTYGATAYIVAYPQGHSWVLSKLPMDRLELVKAPAKADYFLLENEGLRYTFEQGMLRRAK